MCVSIHSTCRGSLWWRMCVFVSGEQMDSAPSPLLSCVLLAGVWHERATGHGNQKRSHVIPPGPPISSSGRHLPHLQPTAAWRSFSLRTLGERERGELQIWVRQALGGEVSLLWPLLQPQPAVWLLDNRRCGMAVWWAVMSCVCVCECVRVCATNVCMSFSWLVGVITMLDAEAL